MTMRRVVAAETLDGLGEDDPAAVRSRRDLRRVHVAMGTRGIVARALRELTVKGAGSTRPFRVLELGAGDGSLMLGVARRLAGLWPPVELTLLDRQSLVERSTIERYAEFGWTAKPEVADVFAWAAATAARGQAIAARRRPGARAHAHSDTDIDAHAGASADVDVDVDVDVDAAADADANANASADWDLIVANLFMHHFEGAPLAVLLAAIAVRTDRFFACEPRRAGLALAASHLVGAIGANAVTREDAVLSVHAGFRNAELSALWPAPLEWKLDEYPAGLFSHCFGATRRDVAQRVSMRGM